ncbi:MAG: hypothetical protein ABWY45_16040 [Mycobacterium sp.]
MSLLPWGLHAKPPTAESPQPHPHHLGQNISAAWQHVPHHLPEPHQHYPRRDSYLEAARLSREMGHL